VAIKIRKAGYAANEPPRNDQEVDFDELRLFVSFTGDRFIVQLKT